jgi:hypothetical protein
MKFEDTMKEEKKHVLGWEFVDTSETIQPNETWEWGDEKDAMIASPQNHRILFENQEIRILDVIINPGEREELHTHRWKSVFIVDALASMRYLGASGEVVFERTVPPVPITRTVVTWKEPEGLHAIENISLNQTIHGIRIELKR